MHGVSVDQVAWIKIWPSGVFVQHVLVSTTASNKFATIVHVAYVLLATHLVEYV